MERSVRLASFLAAGVMVVSLLASFDGVVASSSPDTSSTLAPQSGASTTELPLAGDYWPRCQSDSEAYCWELATVIGADGVERSNANGGAYAYCHRGKGPAADGTCVADGSYWLEIGYSNQFTERDLDSSYHWKVRTGSFSPDILMLANTQRTVVSGDASKGWILEIWAKPALKAYKAGCWSSDSPCSGEATADSVTYGISGYMRVLGINELWPSVESAVVRDALRGTFITTNGMTQSWSFAADKFMVTALGPHFMTDGKTVAPGYVKVFLPAAYVLGLRGYSSLDEVTPTNLEVTVSGQLVTPTLTVLDGGILVDTGVQHFSAPNPTVKLLPRDGEAAKVSQLKRGSSISLSSIYRARPREVVKWNASGQCVVRGARLAVLGKVGACRVTATVKRGSRYVVAARRTYRVG